MTTPEESIPPPLPQSKSSWFMWYTVLLIGLLGAKLAGFTQDRPGSNFSALPRPAIAAPAIAAPTLPTPPTVPAKPQVSSEQVASWSYWLALDGIMRDQRRSGTTLISIATDFQIKANQIRGLDPRNVDPAALHCGETVAAYYATIAKVYRYSLSGAHSMQIIAQVVSGRDNGVVSASIELMAEMTHRRAEAVSAADAAHSSLKQRFGRDFQALPAIR